MAILRVCDDLIAGGVSVSGSENPVVQKLKQHMDTAIVGAAELLVRLDDLLLL